MACFLVVLDPLSPHQLKTKQKQKKMSRDAELDPL